MFQSKRRDWVAQLRKLVTESMLPQEKKDQLMHYLGILQHDIDARAKRDRVNQTIQAEGRFLLAEQIYQYFCEISPKLITINELATILQENDQEISYGQIRAAITTLVTDARIKSIKHIKNGKIVRRYGLAKDIERTQLEKKIHQRETTLRRKAEEARQHQREIEMLKLSKQLKESLKKQQENKNNTK